MTLPLNPPLPPQLARSRASLPDGDGWAYEPKYDGFRAVAFVDGDETYLQSRNGRPLSRYFPELQFPRRPLRARRRDRRRPRSTRSASASTPRPRGSPGWPRRRRPTYYAFDLLAHDDDVLLERSYDERRAALEALVTAPVMLTDVVRTAAEAEHWLHEAEGVIAKEVDAPYRPGERTGMIKVKRVRTVDAVVMGWRPGKAERTVGALILGLYDGRAAARGRPLQRLQRQGEARAGRQVRAVRDRRARQRRAEPLDAGPRARVGRDAPRARRRDHLRPRLRWADSPRGQGPALARGQGAGEPARWISSTSRVARWGAAERSCR